MNLDIHSLAITISITFLIMALVLLIQKRLIKNVPGSGWWVLGYVFWSFGFGLEALNQDSSFVMYVVLFNNIFLAAGVFSFYIGIQQFIGRKVHIGWLVSLVSLFLGCMAYFTFIQDNLNIRWILLSISLVLTASMTAGKLIPQTQKPSGNSALFLAICFLIFAIVILVQAVIPIFGYPIHDLISPSLNYLLICLFFLTTSLVWTFGFITMLHHRLMVEIDQSRQNMELIFNTSPEAVFITRLDNGHFINVNEGFSRITGYAPQEVIGKCMIDLNLWNNPAELNRIVEELEVEGYIEGLEFNFRKKDSRVFVGLLSARLIFIQDEPHMISIIHDITPRIQAETALKESEKRYRLLADHVNDVIWTLSLDNKFTYISPSIFNMRGYTPDEAIQQTLAEAVCPGSLKNMSNLIEKALSQAYPHQTIPTEYYEVEQPCNGGGSVWTEQTARVIFDEEGNAISLVGISRDITERRNLKEWLQRQATIDELTGVINRRQFLKVALSELKRAQRLNHPLSVIMIDIDYFKKINDTYGHAGGDHALLTFAKICQENIREIDFFGRLGGDEFAMLLPETKKDQAHITIDRIREALFNEEIDISGQAVSLTISCGIACMEGQKWSLTELLEKADQALYHAKEAGRNCVRAD